MDLTANKRGQISQSQFSTQETGDVRQRSLGVDGPKRGLQQPRAHEPRPAATTHHAGLVDAAAEPAQPDDTAGGGEATTRGGEQAAPRQIQVSAESDKNVVCNNLFQTNTTVCQLEDCFVTLSCCFQGLSTGERRCPKTAGAPRWCRPVTSRRRCLRAPCPSPGPFHPPSPQ